MFLFASGADVIIDKEVASGFEKRERINGFKPRIRKVKSNAKKA